MDKNMYSVGCLAAFKEAKMFAEKKKYEYLSVDNFILFLARTKFGQDFFTAMGLTLSHFEEEVIKFLDENIPKTLDRVEPEYTVQLTHLESIAYKASKSGNKNKIEEGYFFASLYELEEDECFVLNYFTSFDISRFDVMSYVSQGKKKIATDVEEVLVEKNKQFLTKYGILLNQKAENKKIDNVIGRSKEITSMIEVLCQKKKNNPILVGEPGVGKTAIIEGLAKKINEGSVPDLMKQSKIYLIDISSMIAGSKYRGDFEEKLKGVIKEAVEDKSVILAIDEIHTLIGAGANQGNMDGANMLKPMLASGELKLIGATTYEEYRKYFEKDAALTRRFKKIDIVEPTSEETIEIIKGLKEQYETFHGVTYSDESITKAVELSVKYINDKFLPDKAFDVIDLAGSKAKLNGIKLINENFINQVFATITRIPVDSLEEAEKNNIKSLGEDLKKEIFGQDEAVEKIVDSIILSKSNLIQKEKPIGSFLLAGPTGVGKTELSKQIAKKLNIPLLRYDMSEYMEKHSVAKFIGTAPGYVGFDQGGILVEAIKKNPNCVLLLDEIEKAHEDILNVLLQIMDYASLTDNQGRKANFKNVILMMTSNMGAKAGSKAKFGFSKEKSDEKEDRDGVVKKRLSPEFFNRLDAVIQFNALNEVQIKNVIKKQLNQLEKVLSNSKVIAFMDDSLVDFIAKNGFDPELGARPIERFIEKNISIPLSKELLFGHLVNGGEVKIFADKDIQFDFLKSYSEKKKRKKQTKDV